jgi:hypothetical protein
MSDEKKRHSDVSAGAQHDAGDDSALTLVESLMAERRRYEQWLAALEARRDSTPERVFTRVHADYHDRLDAVVEQLKEHTEGLRAELASLTLRLTAIEEEQQQRYDERAEAELRAHVGELTPAAWEQIAAEADRAIESLTAKNAELEDERRKTRELLNEAERPTPARTAPAVLQAPPSAQEPAAPAASRVEPRREEVPRVQAPSPPAPTRDAPDPSRAAAPPAARELPIELPPPVIAAEARIIEAAASGSPSASADRLDADVTPPPTQRADATRLSGQSKSTFDELAFLSSVVDTPPGVIDTPPADLPDERARRDSFAQRATEDGIVNLANDPDATLQGTGAGRAGSPLAMNVSGNIPIVIKDKTTEAAKSLKCGECGAMNYPTEWYCERCGAELASL